MGKTKGNTVSNLSSSKALQDITLKHGGNYETGAVGEVNVVAQMKKKHAVIGGEGNGVIYPASHYGRDSLVGVALFLSHLSHSKMTCKQLRNTYPNYYKIKDKVEFSMDTNLNHIFKLIKDTFSFYDINNIDGLKIDFKEGWAHLRKSNTEPIVRLYVEHVSFNKAKQIKNSILTAINKIL